MVSSVGGSVVVVLDVVDVLVVDDVLVVEVDAVAAVDRGVSVIGGLSEEDFEQAAMMMNPHKGNHLLARNF